jgi:hypothetical protein
MTQKIGENLAIRFFKKMGILLQNLATAQIFKTLDDEVASDRRGFVSRTDRSVCNRSCTGIVQD